MLGFRFDAGRDAYVLRLVGRRFGPVLRSEPHDSAARAMEWPEDLQRAEDRGAGGRRRTGRFKRSTEQLDPGRREHSLRD